MKKAYDDSSTTYTPTHYWHSTMHFRQNWSTGLSSGGFNSVVAGGGSGGSGGATSSGGGGGAGGGVGCGAREHDSQHTLATDFITTTIFNNSATLPRMLNMFF